MVLVGVIGGYALASVTGQTITFGGGNAPTAAPTNAPTQAPPPPVARDVVPISDEDHVRGNPDAEITIFEYSDYECPFCSRHHPTLQAVLDKYGDDVNWVYRHFPLSFHPNAMPAARASECIAELGGNDAFWEFTDLVFSSGSFDFKAHAESLGVDAAAFDDCFASGKYDQKIQDQMAKGSASGVSGTPGNIVYNNVTKEAKLVSGAQPQSAFDAAVEELKQ